MEQQDLEEDQFYKVFQEDSCYSFTSPTKVTQVFPTPYLQVQQAKRNIKLSPINAGLSMDDTNVSSLLENNILPTQELEHDSDKIGVLGRGDNAIGAVGGKGKTTCLSDVNTKPSMVLNFENFPNEIFLDSADQFREIREYLQDSPMNFGFWQAKTPAKTPLKFLQHSQQTPLRNIDINQMFGSVGKSTLSPSKRLYPVTPFGRKAFGETETPFACMGQTSSNNAVADFQKARKEENPLDRTPVSKRSRCLNNKKPEYLNTTTSPSFISSFLLKPAVSGTAMQATGSLSNTDISSASKLTHDRDDDNEQDYGSSPTTIQLASSVTKSARNHFVHSPTMINHENTTLANHVFDITASPTPNLIKNSNNTPLPLRIPELPKLGSFKSVASKPKSIPITLGMGQKENLGNLEFDNSGAPTFFSTANNSLSLDLVSSIPKISSNPVYSKYSQKTKSKNKACLPTQSKFQFIMTNANSFTVDAQGSASTKRKLKRSQSTFMALNQNSKSTYSSIESTQKARTTCLDNKNAVSNKRKRKNFSYSQ